MGAEWWPTVDVMGRVEALHVKNAGAWLSLVGPRSDVRRLTGFFWIYTDFKKSVIGE
jgi:hypothetical protein